MTIENLRVYDEGAEVTLGRLPDPASLDDEVLDLWQFGSLMWGVNGAIYENHEASRRLEAFEAAIRAEWDRRGLQSNLSIDQMWSGRYLISA